MAPITHARRSGVAIRIRLVLHRMSRDPVERHIADMCERGKLLRRGRVAIPATMERDPGLERNPQHDRRDDAA